MKERTTRRPRVFLAGLMLAAAAVTPWRPSAAAESPFPDVPPTAPPARDAAAAPAAAPAVAAPTAAPPRLRFTDGPVSFWRPGAEEWVEATANTPLAAGDELYAADGANAEVEVVGQTFLRAGADLEVGLESVD